MFEPISHRKIFDYLDSNKEWLSRFESQVLELAFSPCTAEARDRALSLQQETHELHAIVCELEDFLDAQLWQAFQCYQRAMEMSLKLNGELYLLKNGPRKGRAA